MISSTRQCREKADEKITDRFIRDTPELMDKPIVVVQTGDIVEVEIMPYETFDVIHLRRVLPLVPVKNGYIEPAHCQSNTPLAGFFAPPFVKSASKVRFGAAIEECCRLFTHDPGGLSVSGIYHTGLNAGKVGDIETPHRFSTPVSEEVGDNAGAFWTSEKEVGSFDSRRRVAECGQLPPEPIRIFAPDHVRVDEQVPIERAEPVQMVLEADDRPVRGGQNLEQIENPVQPGVTKQFDLLFIGIQGYPPAPIVATNRKGGGDGMTEKYLGTVRM